MARLRLLGSQLEDIPGIVIEPESTLKRPGFDCERCHRHIPYIVLAGSRKRIYRVADLPKEGHIYCFSCSAIVRREQGLI